MRHSEMDSLQYSDLNRFLFSDVGTEANGMTLTVASLFARLGRDPWREAGYLAGLPQVAAGNRLAERIATMPTGTWEMADARLIADRLLPLLPRRTGRDSEGQVNIPFWPRLAWTMAFAGCAAASVAIGMSLFMH